MLIKLSSRMQHLHRSEIRELLKITQDPDIISFAGGMPATELFPVLPLLQVTGEILAREGGQALQYSTTEGDPGLREGIARRLAITCGRPISPDELLIVGGSQQGLDLLGRVLLDEGDVILCESPTYLGAISAFLAHAPRFVQVPTDDQGLVPAALERSLLDHDRVKLLYVVPDFQNPSGRRWPLDRRRQVMSLVAQHDVLVVEDRPYGDLCFAGPVLPPLKALDIMDQVALVGTFSKILCPGLRVGWVAAPRALSEACVLAKQAADLHTSTLAQRQVACLLDHPTMDLDRHIARLRQVYRERCQTMLQAMDRAFPPGVRYTRPEGGLFVWVELPPGLDARQVLAAALEQQVAFVPGGAFFPEGGHENTLRLSFSNASPARIVEGIGRLGRVLSLMLERQGAEKQPAAGASSR